MNTALPPGQRARADFPRFGLTPYADRFPRDTQACALHVSGAVEHEAILADALAGLPRVEQASDFHCVTTWSCRALRWGGVRFVDFHEQVLLPRARPRTDARYVLLRAQDGYRTAMLIEDLLAPDVLLADTLDGQPLTLAHGAPLRLVAPAHYGYKNLKHLARLEFRVEAHRPRPAWFRFMDHPRARVALEERGRVFPGWLLRWLYRPLVGGTVRTFAQALARHEGGKR